MTIKCAWCQKDLGEKEGEGITHSICDDCMIKQFPVPHVDHQLLIECKQSGIAPHELAQITAGYEPAYEEYQQAAAKDKPYWASIWSKCHKRLSSIRKATRRAKLLRNHETRKYVV